MRAVGMSTDGTIGLVMMMFGLLLADTVPALCFFYTQKKKRAQVRAMQAHLDVLTEEERIALGV